MKKKKSNRHSEKLKSGNLSQKGPDTRTNWSTDRRSQCNLDFDFDFDFDSRRLPRGGGLEYIHRIPASLKRLWRTNPVPGGGGYTYGNLALQVGRVSCETVKYGREFCRIWSQEWLLWQGPEAIVRVNYKSIFSSERTPYIKKKVLGSPTPRRTGQLTVGRKINPNLNLVPIGTRLCPDRFWGLTSVLSNAHRCRFALG
jgi:hypothetical protein